MQGFEISRYSAAKGEKPAPICLSAIFGKIDEKSRNHEQAFQSNVVHPGQTSVLSLKSVTRGITTATGPVQRQICSQFKDESGRWSDDTVGYGFALLAESKFIKANSWVIPGGIGDTVMRKLRVFC